MSKDPAFLFYPADFMIGTALMNFEQRGKYISLLCYQNQLGHLRIDDLTSICGEDNMIFSKFKKDKKGLYYNERLEEEMLKRSNYTTSRRNNAKGHVKHMPEHMEDENRNEIVNEVDVKNNKPIYDLSWPISYLNQLLGTRYSTTIKGNLDVVKARYSEGRTQSDFKTVIDKKVAQWRSDEKMAKYLRPETLFNRTKFESYLNELTKAEESTKFWLKHPKTCTECWGNGYISAQGSGVKIACREKYEGVK